jgi:uncharacterized protein Veg
MRSQEELIERLSEYGGAQYIYHPEGHIAWQLSTGENIEILFIQAEKGKGKYMLKEMCNMIRPYHSVFVVRQIENLDAGKFYRKWGFKEYRLPDLYRGGDAIIGIVNYDELCQNLSTI